MSKKLRTGLFGATPVNLMLGRACCLNDNPPVGIYDPDPQAALRGALFLGISARADPLHLDPEGAPLEVLLLGNPELPQLTRKGQPRSLLTIALFEPQASDNWGCHAVTDWQPNPNEPAITSTPPALTFWLSGDPVAVERGRAYLESLSENFRFEIGTGGSPSD